MERKIEVGVLGATGMVGQQFINQLKGHPWFELTWVGASERSAELMMMVPPRFCTALLSAFTAGGSR